MPKKKSISAKFTATTDYDGLLSGVVSLLESARRTSARAVNAIMTATYWEVGRRVVQVEQGGEGRADYGLELIERLSADLVSRFGRGFSPINLRQMRRFFILWPSERIQQTVSAELARDPGIENQQTVSVDSETIKSTKSSVMEVPSLRSVAVRFPLPWSHYVKLMSVDDENARYFYEKEALLGGWSVRQLDRQISTLFYQRTLLSKNKAAMLRKGSDPQAGDLVTADEEIKDPLVLEFLNLKDEYSERELEEALTRKLEDFLLELGSDFAFVGRQKRLRIGNEWYRIDLLFFHRRLKCLVVIDLKLGKFTHADSGQMHLYLNYAREHWTHEDENPPVGLILCAEKDEAVAHYSLDGLPNKVMATEYKMALPAEKVLSEELGKTHRALELRSVRNEISSPTGGDGRAKKKNRHRPRGKSR